MGLYFVDTEEILDIMSLEDKIDMFGELVELKKFNISKEEYDEQLPRHKDFIAKDDYEINLPLIYFTSEEKVDLQKNGYWYNALAEGFIIPITAAQQKFVNVINGRYETIGKIGASWIKYTLIKNNWHDLYTILSASNKEERKILTSILKIKSVKLDDIISKLASSSQNLNGFLGNITSYHTILIKVSKKLKLETNDKNDRQLERQISQHIFNEALSKMDEAEKAKLEIELSKIVKSDNGLIKTGSIIASLTAANLSGFGVYLLATSTLGTLSGIIGVTLPFAAYTALTSSIAFITGPVGWVGAGAYALWKFTDVDYKKLIPCIVYIHWLREKYN